MVKWYNSLGTKLTVSFLILILFVSMGTFLFTVQEAKNALTDQMKEELVLTAKVMSSQIDGDLLYQINGEQDTENAAFMQVYQKLDELRGGNGDIITYLYIMRLDEEGNARFIVDADYIEDGVIDVYANQLYEEAPIEDIKKGLAEPHVSEEPYTDEWGTFMTGYAPIYDSNGNIAGVLGVDFDIATVKQKQDFLSSLVYYILFGSILAATSVILYFSLTIIKDLNSITKVAENISNGELDIKLPIIKSKSEIYELNEGMKSVFAAIEFLSGEAEKNSK
ncbi:PDC sensor domain-containing protein [uncultured Methanomethylovorans sp.]|uniref:PDC sensor domain-containing protein n=1 Tax=uncultured Methanomethylovorans sp. TaxID=183759 RepID=UPI002AA653FE|nr:PDC sensor domain-containing protein [uncultured Methanomethylovorans sp.]